MLKIPHKIQLIPRIQKTIDKLKDAYEIRMCRKNFGLKKKSVKSLVIVGEILGNFCEKEIF